VAAASAGAAGPEEPDASSVLGDMVDAGGDWGGQDRMGLVVPVGTLGGLSIWTVLPSPFVVGLQCGGQYLSWLV
jgi:hypothetical protein